MFGLTKQWHINAASTMYGTSIWRSIRNIWPRLAKNTFYEVGASDKILRTYVLDRKFQCKLSLIWPIYAPTLSLHWLVVGRGMEHLF